MRVTYLLERADLGGGTKVVLAHARLLERWGHRVTIAARGPLPPGFAYRGRYRDLDAGPPPGPPPDLLVATFWTTLARARELTEGPIAHFCQGFEGEIAHFRSDWPAIEVAYAEPLPTFAVTPRLAELLARRFQRPARVLPPPAESTPARPGARRAPRRSPWIALFGAFEAEVKGIPLGLETVRRVRAAGIPARLLRISVLPLSEAERSRLAPDRYLLSVPPGRALAELAECDLLLFPSGVEEGFGLPLLEAMALGVPAVASRTPGLEFVSGGTGALLADAGDGEGFAHAALELLRRPPAWRAQRRAGRRAATRFAPERIGAALDRAVRWAAAGAPGGASAAAADPESAW